MSDYYDRLETRPPDLREAEQFSLLAALVAHAQAHAPAIGELLTGVDPASLTERGALAQLPLLRKSELMERQQKQPIFGGLSSIAAPELCQIFASPGPIFEPGSSRPDFWRFARALYAAGFRRGEILHNCFS
jgi:phenylacetate-CoA ligase